MVINYSNNPVPEALEANNNPAHNLIPKPQPPPTIPFKVSADLSVDEDADMKPVKSNPWNKANLQKGHPPHSSL